MIRLPGLSKTHRRYANTPRLQMSESAELLSPESSSGAVKQSFGETPPSAGSSPVRIRSGRVDDRLAVWTWSKSTLPWTRPWKVVCNHRSARVSWQVHRATLNSVYSPLESRTSRSGPPGAHWEIDKPAVGFAASLPNHPRDNP